MVQNHEAGDSGSAHRRGVCHGGIADSGFWLWTLTTMEAWVLYAARRGEYGVTRHVVLGAII
jgi:hypothetical protein